MKTLLCLLAIPCGAQPSWTSIATPSTPYQYFRYWGEGADAQALEHANFDPANPHPAGSRHPYSYRFFSGPTPKRSVCALEDRPDLYWYSRQRAHLAGTFVTPNPSDFSVSGLQPKLRGFAVTAQFAGDAKKVGAIEVAYFTDRLCSDGGLEYGFTRDLATDSILVYWSIFANCGNDADGLCRKTNDPSAGPGYKNLQQENGGILSEHGFRIYGLSVSDEYTYKIFAGSGTFHIEVSQNGRIVRCSETPNAPLGPCTFTKTPQPWFPIDRVNAGYIVVGTQTVGDPAIGKAGFTVSDILVAR